MSVSSPPAPSQPSFTETLWTSIAPIYAAILRHPFIAGLTDGSLERARFEFYAVQDALYLREFVRALAVAAARAPKEDWVVMLREHAGGAGAEGRLDRDAERACGRRLAGRALAA